jgi:hypothetical protein
MNRSTFRSFLLAAAASAFVAVLPLASAGAQSLSEPLLTPDQVRSQYLDQGYLVSAPVLWWTNGTTTFTVQDPAEQNSPAARVLMVIVYPDATTAQAAHSQDGHLVPGYGPTVWQDNVALVQSSRSELARRHAAAVNSDDPTYVGTTDSTQFADPSTIVGLDFLAVVQNGLVNL